MSKHEVRIEIENEAFLQIHSALKEFGDLEIGGILIGYKKGHNHFAISEATIADDTKQFRIASFIREPFKSVKILLSAFKTRRHNYIGEWHSHPKFNLYPSGADVNTMKGILYDPNYGVNFALLIITKLNNGVPDLAAFLFHKEVPNFVQAQISKQNKIERYVDIRI